MNTALAGTKEALYELIEIPEPFGPVEFVLDDQKSKAFAFAVDDPGDWYLGPGSPFGGRIGHPLILANDLLFLFYDKYDGNTAKGLHTHEELTFVNPAFVGERITVEGGYVEKYERRGQGYVVMDAVAHGEDGRELVRHRGVEIMRTKAGTVVGRGSASPSGRVVRAEPLPGAEPVTRIVPGLAPGTPLVPLRKVVTQDQMNVFSWAGRYYRNVHTSIERAHEAGLDRTLVQAQQQTAFITELMTAAYGPVWLTGGHLDMRFVSPAFCGDELTIRAAVTGSEGDDRIECEVWVERTDGTKTALGWASAPVEAGGPNRPGEEGETNE